MIWLAAFIVQSRTGGVSDGMVHAIKGTLNPHAARKLSALLTVTPYLQFPGPHG